MAEINYKEINIAKEIPLLMKLRLNKLLNKRIKDNGKVLVINTCLIGEFLATLPALMLFIKRNKLKADIIVSPPTKPIAEKIKGINKVFIAKSIYNRNTEQANENKFIPKEYGSILILRISPDSYNLFKNIKYSRLMIYDVVFFKYFFHVIKNILLKRAVKQWREINFEIIGMGEPSKKIKFEHIFNFNKSDYEQIKHLPEMQGNEEKVLIHTGSGWSAKLWDNDKWAELLKKLNKLGKYRFIFVGGTDAEKKSFKQIQKNVDFKIFSLIKKVDLKTLLLIMRKSNYFIGIDSGPRNMAHLADLRSISLFGPGLKDFMPYDRRDIVIDKSNYRGTKIFDYSKKTAMQKIEVKEVFDAFKKLSKFF